MTLRPLSARSVWLVPVLLLVSACVTQPADPVPTGRVDYACAGGQTLRVLYGQDNGLPSIEINIDGPETLLAELAETGLRYAWPSDGSYHIWELRDGVGTLSYRDGAAATVTPVRTSCRAS
jgi:hypothetical protein